MSKQLYIKAILFLCVLFLTGCIFNNAVELQHEPYRGLPYHAATTKTPPYGVKRISAAVLKESLSSDNPPILIDVYGAIFREESLDFDGAWLVSTPRENLPNSVWLPNVGKQVLKAVVEQYYSDQLVELTDGDKTQTLVIYCIEDCWMAWNAAKRAHEWGYVNVKWFREGVDGWNDNGWALQDSEPVSLPVND